MVDRSKLAAYCYLEVPLGLLFKHPSLYKQDLSLPSSTRVKPSMGIRLRARPKSVKHGQLGGQPGPGGPAPAPPEHQHLPLMELGLECPVAPLLQTPWACPWMVKYRTGGGQSRVWVSCSEQRCWVNPELKEDGLGARPSVGCHIPYVQPDKEGRTSHPLHRPLRSGFAMELPPRLPTPPLPYQPLSCSCLILGKPLNERPVGFPLYFSLQSSDFV